MFKAFCKSFSEILKNIKKFQKAQLKALIKPIHEKHHHIETREQAMFN